MDGLVFTPTWGMSRDRTGDHMTRTQQTFTIVAAMFAVGLMLAFFLWDPEPGDYFRCDNWVYAIKSGGTPEACKSEAADAAGRRLRGYY